MPALKTEWYNIIWSHEIEKGFVLLERVWTIKLEMAKALGVVNTESALERFTAFSKTTPQEISDTLKTAFEVQWCTDFDHAFLFQIIWNMYFKHLEGKMEALKLYHELNQIIAENNSNGPLIRKLKSSFLLWYIEKLPDDTKVSLGQFIKKDDLYCSDLQKIIKIIEPHFQELTNNKNIYDTYLHSSHRYYYQKEQLFYNLYQQYLLLDWINKKELHLALGFHFNETGFEVSTVIPEMNEHKESELMFDVKSLFEDLKKQPDNEDLLYKLLFVVRFQYFGKPLKFIKRQLEDLKNEYNLDLYAIWNQVTDLKDLKTFLLSELWADIGLSVFDGFIERHFQYFKKTNRKTIVSIFEQPENACIVPYLSEESAYFLFLQIDTYNKQWYNPKRSIAHGKYDDKKKQSLKSMEKKALKRYQDNKGRFQEDIILSHSELQSKIITWIEQWIKTKDISKLSQLMNDEGVLKVNVKVQNWKDEWIVYEQWEELGCVYGALLYLNWSKYDKKIIRKLILSALDNIKNIKNKNTSLRLTYLFLCIDQQLLNNKKCKEMMISQLLLHKEDIARALELLWVNKDNGWSYQTLESVWTNSSVSYNDTCSIPLREQFMAELVFDTKVMEYISQLDVDKKRKLLKQFSTIPESQWFTTLSLECDKDFIIWQIVHQSWFTYARKAIQLYDPSVATAFRINQSDYSTYSNVINATNITKIKITKEERISIMKEWLQLQILTNPQLLYQLLFSNKKDNKSLVNELLLYEKELWSISSDDILESIKSTDYKYRTGYYSNDSYQWREKIGGFNEHPWRVLVFYILLLHTLWKEYDLWSIIEKCTSNQEREIFIHHMLWNKQWAQRNEFLDNSINKTIYRNNKTHLDGSNILTNSPIILMAIKDNKHLRDFADILFLQMSHLVALQDFVGAARLYVHFIDLYIKEFATDDPSWLQLTKYFDEKEWSADLFTTINTWLSELNLPEQEKSIIESIQKKYLGAE